MHAKYDAFIGTSPECFSCGAFWFRAVAVAGPMVGNGLVGVNNAAGTTLPERSGLEKAFTPDHILEASDCLELF
jgi:hypothetical protein